VFLDNRLNGLELGGLVRRAVEPVEECAVQLVVEHFGELVARD